MFSSYYNTAPDYSNINSWAAFPGKKSNALLLPFTSSSANSKLLADAFYIHPTTYMSGVSLNASLSDINVNKATDIGPIKHQASIFNESCLIYAPRYRQAIVSTFFMKSPEAEEALNIAYSDIRAAFDLYLKSYNKGRPFFIAGHSQGAMLAVRLLKEFIDDLKFKKEFIAAYIPGVPVKKNEFKNIESITKPGETGCFATWNTYLKGTKGYDQFYKDIVCVNPLTWASDERMIDRKNHLGAVPVTFDRVERSLVSAQVVEGKLEIDPINTQGYSLLNQNGNYHLADFNLFYMDVRENVKLQVENFYRYFDSK